MRVAAAQLGYAGMGAMVLSAPRGLSLSGLGYADTDTLPAGTVITFGVHGTPCSGIYEKDITDDLNNWAGSMIQINSVSTTAEGFIPMVVDVIVNATVKQAVTAGILRGQIIAALAALSNSSFWSTCAGGVSLKDGSMSAALAPASGGTANTSTCPQGTVANAQGICLCSNGQPPNAQGVCPTSSIPWTTIAIAAGAGLVGLIVLMVVIKR